MWQLKPEALDHLGEDKTRRLGSTGTDGSGSFRLEVAQRSERGERPWDLQLMVLAPDRAHRDRRGR